MFFINSMSSEPIYEQLVLQAEEFILTGIIKSGDMLPSVRNLSVSLSINPNTIQKAYTELSTRGIVFSVPGKGCFVSNNAAQIIRSKNRDNFSALKAQIEKLKLSGVKEEEILNLTKSIYEGGQHND